MALVVSDAPATRAEAGELARQGRFAVEIMQSGSWEGFAIGHRHWVWIARRTGVFSGEGILDGMTSNCVSKGSTLFGVSEATVHCENIDADGDKIFETSTETGVWTRGGKGGTGSGTFLGGTGKYERIRGAFEIVRKVGPRDEATRSWTDYVTVTGNWTLP
jgi:hypothetical protein